MYSPTKCSTDRLQREVGRRQQVDDVDAPAGRRVAEQQRLPVPVRRVDVLLVAEREQLLRANHVRTSLRATCQVLMQVEQGRAKILCY